jgi:hypothetical protein
MNAWRANGDSSPLKGGPVPNPICNLLLACARTTPVEESLWRSITEWPSLLAAADDHGLTPLLHAKVTACPGIPEEITRRLRDAYVDSAKRALFLTARLLVLLDRFEANGVRSGISAHRSPVSTTRRGGCRLM